MSTTDAPDLTGLRALFLNATLKRSPEVSNTQALVDASAAIMEAHGVATTSIRVIDHDVATGVWPDMTEHGWETDSGRPSRAGLCLRHLGAGRADLAPATTAIMNDHRASTGSPANDKPVHRYYGTPPALHHRQTASALLRTSICSTSCSSHANDAGWISKQAGSSYLDPVGGGVTSPSNTTFMTWNLLYLAKLLRRRRHRLRQPASGVGRR